MPIARALSRSSLLAAVATLVACVGEMPPPPSLAVTSPERGLVQGAAGRVTVHGVARPGPSGSAIARVDVNDVRATLAPDGSFTAVVELDDGATLLQTVATSDEGGAATDVRAVQVGELRPVGTKIDRAITVALSADAFARLAAAAGPIVTSTDLEALLAPLQPMANLGNSIANLRLSITRLRLGGATFTLVPVEGGLAFSAELTGLDVGANAAYDGTLVIAGSTSVTATADRVTIGGTLVVTPAGTSGFTVRIASPDVGTTNLRLGASGLTGRVLQLLQDNLRATIADVTTRSAELALQPLVNRAFGALAGPQRLDVKGQQLDLEASAAAVAFSPAGAQVTVHLAARLAGSEASPGYVFTPNGTPAIDPGAGVQIGLADDLVNALLAQVHAIGLLDLHITEDVGVFDTVDIRLSMPPMVSASSPDGRMRLVLGDMIATFRNDGTELARAALNAQVELQVRRGEDDEQIALDLGQVRMFVNLLGPSDGEGGDPAISDAAAAGLTLQLDSLEQFLIRVPVPSVAGVSVDRLALRADSGYVVMSGELR